MHYSTSQPCIHKKHMRTIICSLPLLQHLLRWLRDPVNAMNLDVHTFMSAP